MRPSSIPPYSIPPAPPAPSKSYFIQVLKNDAPTNFVLESRIGMSQRLQERAALILLLAHTAVRCDVIKTRHGLHYVTDEGQIWLHLEEEGRVTA